jgi:uncharacterized membrane protein YeaQ/YmgE (transglycosylase-associated protein family)
VFAYDRKARSRSSDPSLVVSVIGAIIVLVIYHAIAGRRVL